MFVFSAIKKTKYSLFARKTNLNVKTSLFTTKQALSLTDNTIATTLLCLPIPLFLKKWNVIGSISISRSLESHPSSGVMFQTCKEYETDIRLTLQNGRIVNLFGLGFRIVDFNSKPVSPESNQIEVQLSLAGIHNSFGNPSRHPLDLPVKLKGENCDKSGWRSLSNYAKEVGVKYFGKGIYIYVSRSSSPQATTTIRQLLSRAVVNGQFVYYSNPDRVEAKDWGKTTRHNFQGYYSIQSDTFSGAGYLLPEEKVQLAVEYSNAEISLSQIEELETEEKDTLFTRWEFENAKSLVDCQTPAEPLVVGENVYILKNPTTDILRDPSIAFDSGGFTKTAHEITEENGLETRRKTKVWGWVTNSVDSHSVIDKDAEIATDQNYSKSVAISKYHRVIFTPYKSFNFISSAWQQVSETITTRKYNEEGYLIEQKTTGKKLFRLKQDNSSLEGINTQLSALDLLKEAEEKKEPEKSQLQNRGNALLKLAQAYRFTETEPIKKTITYELQPLSKYFSDISKPWDKCDWVEPRFAHHTLTTEAKRLVKDNPGSTEDFPLPPITVGREFKEEQKITITSRKKPGRFVTTRFLLNAEGEGLDQKLKLTSSGESIGRPSIHQRKENINNNPPPSFVATGGSSAFLGQRQLSDRNKQYKYLLNSEGSNSRGDIPNGSISFPDVYDVGVAQDAAFTKLSIDNTKEAEILTIKTLYQPNYQEGDRVIFEGKEYGFYRTYCAKLTSKLPS